MFYIFAIIAFVFGKNSETWAGIAQLVQRLGTGRTVRGSNPSGGQFFPHPPRPALGPTQPPIPWYQVVPGGKAARAWH